jgi:hypothetical protein
LISSWCHRASVCWLVCIVASTGCF